MRNVENWAQPSTLKFIRTSPQVRPIFFAFPQHPIPAIIASMLELRPNCECCNRDLPPSAPDALICTFECTFCAACVTTFPNRQCPNCGGNLQPRPIRPAASLAQNPASTTRIHNPAGCAK